MNWERFNKVLAPKVQGGWNLHTLTQDKPLDFFILFSSAASLLGSPGQANHVAANTFLDTLAHYRRSQGLPALSINWGVWSDIGAAAKRQLPSFYLFVNTTGKWIFYAYKYQYYYYDCGYEHDGGDDDGGDGDN